MKKHILFVIVAMLILAMLAGCGKEAAEETKAPAETEAAQVTVSGEPVEETEAEQTTPATEAPVEEEEEDIVYEGDASSYYIDQVYADQIQRYHTALTEQWTEEQYLENGMSSLPVYYYEGKVLENVGFGFVNLDNDGHWELVIGAILNAEQDPAVFEIWTLVDGEPVMLAQGSSRNRYVLQYVEEDEMWYVVNEASNGAANHATYYMTVTEGKLEVTQGIVFDAGADEENPWFMTWDQDWDVSNDDPIDEEMANAVLESHRKHYTALEYFPYIFY